MRNALLTAFLLAAPGLLGAAEPARLQAPPKSLDEAPEPPDELSKYQPGVGAPPSPVHGALPAPRPAPAPAAARPAPAPAPAPRQAPDAARMLERAKALYAEKRWDEEKAELLAAARVLPKDDPRRIEATGMLAAIALKKKNLAQAEKLYWRAIEFAKQRKIKSAVVVDAYIGMAYCMEGQGKSADAATVYRVALAQMAPADPRRPQVQSRLAALSPRPAAKAPVEPAAQEPSGRTMGVELKPRKQEAADPEPAYPLQDEAETPAAPAKAQTPEASSADE